MAEERFKQFYLILVLQILDKLFSLGKLNLLPHYSVLITYEHKP